MKVYVRTYRVQITLIIMGAIMCIAAASKGIERFTTELFYMGTFCVFLGIFAWLLVQVSVIMGKGKSQSGGGADAPQRKLRSTSPGGRGRY